MSSLLSKYRVIIVLMSSLIIGNVGLPLSTAGKC